MKLICSNPLAFSIALAVYARFDRSFDRSFSLNHPFYMRGYSLASVPLTKGPTAND
jgi:hypothetical protein